MITKNSLYEQTDYFLGGVQRRYLLSNGWELSALNCSKLHDYNFAWEIALINPTGEISYDTPIADDVMIFHNDEDANEFINKAIRWGSA